MTTVIITSSYYVHGRFNDTDGLTKHITTTDQLQHKLSYHFCLKLRNINHHLNLYTSCSNAMLVTNQVNEQRSENHWSPPHPHQAE
jgi:hypothetical protein